MGNLGAALGVHFEEQKRLTIQGVIIEDRRDGQVEEPHSTQSNLQGSQERDQETQEPQVEVFEGGKSWLGEEMPRHSTALKMDESSLLTDGGLGCLDLQTDGSEILAQSGKWRGTASIPHLQERKGPSLTTVCSLNCIKYFTEICKEA